MRWSKPPSDTEETKAARAAARIDKVLRASPALEKRSVEVYGTGSFWNRTNTPSDSDVDAAAVCRNVCHCDFPPGYSLRSFGLAQASYTFEAFRSDVYAALRSEFGAELRVGKKSFKVPENTYRLDADVTAFIEYRRYAVDGTFVRGVYSIPLIGVPFVNFHEAHHENGKRRNNETGRRFKRIVRIFKRLRSEMLERGTTAQRAAADRMVSYLLECLVFNAPDVSFVQRDTYLENTRMALDSLLSVSMDEMWEVNCRKQLFGAGQSWTQPEVKSFLKHAIAYLG